MANIKLNLDSLKTRREWKRHKVKDGQNIFRIGPPHGESSNGYAYRKWQIIWGLVDPESGRARPFASSMTSEKKCPVTEYVAQLKKKAEAIKAQLTTSGLDEDSVKEQMGPLNKLISDLTPKTVYLYNAIDKSGELGLLELKSTAHKKMKTQMAQYVNDYNQDPTSLNSSDDDSGVWFNVIRTGEGRDTEYDVKKCQFKIKKPAGGFNYEDDRSELPESIVANYDSQAYDLGAVYQIKSYEALAEILKANMNNLIELCPDADLSSVVLGSSGSITVTTNGTSKGGKAVTTRFDDADDTDTDDTNTTVNTVSFRGIQQRPVTEVTGTSAKHSKPAINDDFIAEANALLEE